MSRLDDEHDQWVGSLALEELRGRLVELGARDVLVKSLSPSQGNDKNQVRLGTDLSGAASLLPLGGLVGTRTSSAKPGVGDTTLYKADVDFSWLTEHGPERAPQAKAIYYPQYPEVRLSGLMSGCQLPPRTLYSWARRGQTTGRVLVLGVAARKVYGVLLPPESPATRELKRLPLERYDVVCLWQLGGEAPMSRAGLLAELHGVHLRGWVAGARIRGHGDVVRYWARPAGGATLEAQLGVVANAAPEPDFHGWELKSHGVVDIETGRGGSPLTLLTSEPSGGLYRDNFTDFMWTYGHRKIGRSNRLDFTGTQRVGGDPDTRNGTRLIQRGYDGSGREHDPEGYIALIDGEGRLAASWMFVDLLDHWRHKHARAVYVPSIKNDGLHAYRYGARVKIAEGASFLQFMTALAQGRIFYDPGSWMTHDDDGRTTGSKRRTQWRIRHADLDSLYDSVEVMDARSVPADNSGSSHDLARLNITLPQVGWPS